MTVLPEETHDSVMSEVERLMAMDRPLVIDDLEQLLELESGYRFELDEGVLVMSGAPSVFHQIASGKLTHLLIGACPPGMLAIAAPGVLFTDIQFRIPDIIVTTTDSIRSKYLERPPLLAVEIASPSTKVYDRTRKMQVYSDFGIQDYWIISPDRDKPAITSFTPAGKWHPRAGRAGREYREDARAAGDEPFSTERPFPVSFTPAELVSLGDA